MRHRAAEPTLLLRAVRNPGGSCSPAVYDRHILAVTAAVAVSHRPSPADPTQRLRAGLSAFVNATLADERAARINYFQMVGVSAELEVQRRGVLRAYAELIAAQAAELDDLGPLGRGDRRMTAVALTGATDGLITDWMSSEQRAPRQAIVYTLLQIFGTESVRQAMASSRPTISSAWRTNGA